MGNSLLRHSDSIAVTRDQHEFTDEFIEYTDGKVWTKLASDTNATVAHEGTAGGSSRLKLYGGDATDNNEASFRTTNKLFKFIGGKAMIWEDRINYSEAATSAANISSGFADTFGANQIADNGGAIAVTDGALIFKKDGDTVWSFHTEINGVSTATQSTTTAGGSADQTLRIEITPRSSTVFEARPFVDGAQLRDANGNSIMHTITLGTATDMYAGSYMKQGSSNSQAVYHEYSHFKFDR